MKRLLIAIWAVCLPLLCSIALADQTQDIANLKAVVADLQNRVDVTNWFLGNTRNDVRSIFTRLDLDEYWIGNGKSRIIGVEHRADNLENNVSSLQLSLNALRDVFFYYKNNNPQPNLLSNGDFSQPIGNNFLITTSVPGWQVVRGNVQICPSTEWQPCPGTIQTLGLNGDNRGGLQQSFPTMPGQQYTFSGYMSHDFGGISGSADVYLNGLPFVKLFHGSLATQLNMSWKSFSYTFIASATVTVLSIYDTTPGTITQGMVLGNLVIN